MLIIYKVIIYLINLKKGEREKGGNTIIIATRSTWFFLYFFLPFLFQKKLSIINMNRYNV